MVKVKRDTSLSSDLLIGADAIAEFIGLDSPRPVYHAWRMGKLKTAFKMFGKICQRKSDAREEFRGRAA